jgi:hypothetical protein
LIVVILLDTQCVSDLIRYISGVSKFHIEVTDPGIYRIRSFVLSGYTLYINIRENRRGN